MAQLGPHAEVYDMHVHVGLACVDLLQSLPDACTGTACQARTCLPVCDTLSSDLDGTWRRPRDWQSCAIARRAAGSDARTPGRNPL